MTIPGTQTLSRTPVDHRLRLAGLEMQVQALAQALRQIAEAVDAATDSQVAEQIDRTLCECRM